MADSLRLHSEHISILAGKRIRRTPPRTLPHGLHFCTDPNVESAFKIHSVMVARLTPMPSTLPLVSHQSCTLALCAHRIIETHTETPENIHRIQGDFIILANK